MKRIILSSILSIFMFLNPTINNLRNPEITLSNGVVDGTNFIEEKVSNDLTRFNNIKVVYDGLVTSKIMLAGTTRLFLNIYNDNFELENQHMFSSLDYPNLVSEDIMVQSNPIRVDNKVYIFFQQVYDDGSATAYRNHLIEVDISTPTPVLKSYSFTMPNNDVGFSFSSIVELDYLDNQIYLTVVQSVVNYSAFTITLSQTLSSGFYQANTTPILNSSFTNNASNIKVVTADSQLGYCYRFSSTVYCKDKVNNANSYSLSLSGIDLTNVIISNQRSLVTRTTAQVNSTTVDVINYYEIRRNTNNNGLEAYLVESLDLNYANSGDGNSQTIFPHLNRSNDQLKFLSLATYYTYNYNTNLLTTNGYAPALYQNIFYNQLGQKLLVHESGDTIYASSDFYSFTFVINFPNRNILAYNYYQDDLLIFAYDNTNSRYAYYKYPILPSSGGSSLVELFNVTDAELRTSLGFTYNVASYTTQIQIDQVIFYKNVVYMLDVNVLSAGTATSKLNLIQILPIGTNVKQIDSLYYNFTGSQNISYTYPDTLDFFPNVGYYFSVKVGLLNGELVKLYLYTGQDEFFTATPNTSGRLIAYFNKPSANINLSELNLDGADTLAYINDLSKVRDIILGVRDLLVFDNYGSGVDKISTQMPIPDQILESYVQGTYSNLYQDFDYQFPYESIFIRLDEHGNLILKDKYNNIYSLYSKKFLKLNDPGLISINNEFLDINANSFDLAVSANINSILINIRSFFNRVLVTNPTPFSLNDGQNVINVTLKSLDNTIKTITFNILKAPAVPSSPPIVLPGLDPNYVPPSSSAQSSSVASSSVISSSISSSSSTSIVSSSNNVITSSSSSIGSDNTTNNEEENPLFIWIILGIPAIITLTILGYAQILKGRAKSKVKVEDKKEEVEIPNSGNKDNQ
jgi:hypothetical protein